MENYKYARNHNGNICRIHVEQDNDPWNPRTEQDGNLGHMMVWWNRYTLGDTNEHQDPESFLNDLVRHNVSETKIINFVKSRKCSNGLELKYNRSEQIWELWGYWKVWWTGNEVHHGVIESNNPIDYLIDDIIESMNFEDKWKLLESEGFYCLPIFIYEHGGITMNIGGFSCPWDSGQAGWIYTTKDEILKAEIRVKSEKGNYIKVTNQNWKFAAQSVLKDEVKTYDMYLQGDVYGYVIDEIEMDNLTSVTCGKSILDEDNFDWNEHTDSCWGYYSEKWGDDLLTEIAMEAGFEKLYDSLKESMEVA